MRLLIAQSYDRKNYLFVWQGVNREKVKVNRQVEAVNAAAAKAHLHKQGIRVYKISKKWRWLMVLTKKSVRASEIVIFSRQLATLIDAGIPLVQALDIIIKSSSNQQLLNLLIALSHKVKIGIKFSVAAEKYPRYFSHFFCSLVRIGEETGSLAKVLDNIANNQEKNQSLKYKIKKALFYPGIIVLVAIIVSAILLLSVIPQFEAIFATFNTKLPVFTLFVIALANHIIQHILIILISIFILAILFILAKHYSKNFNILLSNLVLNLPILGKLARKAMVARFSSMLAIMFTAGIPLVESLKIILTTTNNIFYKNKILAVHDAVSIGDPLHLALEKINLFPAMATQMITVGEETGKLDEMLNKIATIYTEEIDIIIAGFSSLIEPLVVIVVDTVVSGLIIAMYLPIFKLGNII